MRRAVDPTEHVEKYLKWQKGGPNLEYKRPDVCIVVFPGAAQHAAKRSGALQTRGPNFGTRSL